MLRNYFTSVLRYIIRNKAFTAINILGLVIGMTAFILIGQYFVHETSYDKFWGMPTGCTVSISTGSIKVC